MQEYRITAGHLEAFRQFLLAEERSPGTIEKYMRDLRTFYGCVCGSPVTKERVIAYKSDLIERYAPGTVNGILLALNRFFAFSGMGELRVRTVRRQRRVFCEERRELNKDEYRRLLRTARSAGRQRLFLMMQTICATGIRVSELAYITVEAVQQGQTEVYCKGKQRVIFLPRGLQKQLLAYVRKENRTQGSVFVTRSGRPVNRSNIWRDMKSLCAAAGVCADKVFPHNLRHLFARVFYGLERDLVRLADLLGHSSIETTRIYIMENGAKHRRLLDKMGLIL